MYSINKFNVDEKILNHVDKLNYFFNGYKTLTVTELDLTNLCNNNCPYCCGINDNKVTLSIDQIDLIVDSLYAMGNRGVILSGGGEPLLSPHFTYAVERLYQSGMKVGVNSNGLALTEEKALSIADHCDYFRVSLDAASQELYTKMHGVSGSAFEQVIDNCKMFTNIRNHRKNSRTSFGLGFLTSRISFSEMEKFVKLAIECGVDFAQFRPLMGVNDEIYDVSDKIKELQGKYNTASFQVTASFQKYCEMKTNGQRNYKKCHGLFFSTVITANAKVYACLHHRQDSRYYLGQITESCSLEDIFLSPKIREMYEKIDCNECPILCRNDALNRMLEMLSHNVVHKDFL